MFRPSIPRALVVATVVGTGLFFGAPVGHAAPTPSAGAGARVSAFPAARSARSARSAAGKAYASRAGRSPSVPNPNPPLGGLDPDGKAAGGGRLRERGVIQATGAPALPSHLTAQAWMVTDLDTGDVLAARDPHGRYQPASVLKLLTGLVLVPRLPGDRVITATAAAANAEGSAVGLVAGGRYTVDTLFESLYLMSGNDAAMALALANGGPARTVSEMNARARQLGAYDTVVQTPSGLDGWTQLTSPYDLTLILRAALDMPRLVGYDAARTARLPAQRVGKRTWGGVPLFNESADFLDSVPGAVLAKTGYTGAAQHTYACAAVRGGRRIGVVFLRNRRRPLDQYQQAAALLNWAFALPGTIAPVGRLAGTVPWSGPRPTVAASATVGVSAPPASTASSAPRTTTPVGGRRRGEGWTFGPAWKTVAVLSALSLLLRQWDRRRRRRARRHR